MIMVEGVAASAVGLPPPLAGEGGEGEAANTELAASPSRPPPQAGEGRVHRALREAL